MPRIERTAIATWRGSVAKGSGMVDGDSDVVRGIPFSLAARTGNVASKTNPEELLAAAHAACFAMALATQLTRRNAAPERLVVTATCALDERNGFNRIVESRLSVRAAVAVPEETLASAVADADERCPFSALVRASGRVVVEASLESF